ncbi:hypothetical protein EDB81DRAFT_925661 [Dactylonectria macrodidyma]|uniref:Zn(2)-C6 fungal-type domain-containing protein n=1 Tax=Dactylonectria macrodidyma TaxID=307937 RepID=A0A9P9FI17_9HYPO|nr:hypothetical protein EDB81DRAFT_925661 [Dactylonectria macrodidyma]
MAMSTHHVGRGMFRSNELNRLSCVRCKDRKIRCDRVMPQCGRCRTHAAQCVYPERVKRKGARSATEISEASLSTILDRLGRLEAQSATPATSSSPLLPVVEQDPVLTTSHVPSPVTSKTTPCYHDTVKTVQGVDIDVTAILKKAVDQVRDLRLRGLATSVITDTTQIPTDLAKFWIQNYFTHVSACMFLSVVDRRVIEVLPDILRLPYIHIEPPSSSSTTASSTTDVSSLSATSPHLSVPVWQNSATGTMMDFIAALSMAGVAYQYFDEDLAWTMFKHACEYCHALNLHNLDSSEFAWSNNEKCDSDHDRRGLWDAFQFDLFFRLMLNKPPVLTGSSWKVNLPWLDASQPPPEGIEAIVFLAGSRVSLVVTRFFGLLEEHQSRPNDDLVGRTDELCNEILQVFKEWQLHDWIEDTHNEDVNFWEVAEVLLFGYTSMFFMYRKLDVLNSDSPEPLVTDADLPDCPLVVDASRQIVQVMGRVLLRIPYVETMVFFFGTYRCYVAIACLAKSILCATNIKAHMEDIKSLDRLGNQAEVLSRGAEDIAPLVRAIQNLNTEIQQHLNAEES